MTFERKEKPTITFVSVVKGLNSVQECLPKPTQKFIPNWWKEIPLSYPNPSSEFDSHLTTIPTIKACPSYPEYFSQGAILPMWTDTILKYDDDTKTWKWAVADPKFTWSNHTTEQLTKYKKPSYQGHEAPFIFKAISPWRIITPPGVSVYQFPVFYDFNPDFSVLPGILRTDVWHQTNQQVLFHSKNKEIFIKRGTPFVHYIPFFRDKFFFESREETLDDARLFTELDINHSTKFSGSNEYINMQKRSNNE